MFDSITQEPKLFGHISTMGVAPGFPVELTSGPSQTSAMFTDASLPRSKSFRANMSFRIDAAGGGADGLALVFTSDRRLGLGGYGLGYSGLGQVGDFAVEGEALSAKLTCQSTRTGPKIMPMTLPRLISRCTVRRMPITASAWHVPNHINSHH